MERLGLVVGLRMAGDPLGGAGMCGQDRDIWPDLLVLFPAGKVEGK